jgi:tRNA U34 5-methylaminomethyl-2-thiouridine-forming methyltransferase MnmC
MTPTIRTICTADGSMTLYLPEIEENYHSAYGAITESQHIYINLGLGNAPMRGISVMEIGFGTGLNAALSAHWAQSRSQKIQYTGYELYPLQASVVDTLGYADKISETCCDTAAGMQYSSIIDCPWELAAEINPCFTIKKINADILKAYFPAGQDVVFFDAFAPDKQPELWAQPVFEKIAAAMPSGGVFVTYCVKGSVRRAMAAAGFKPERVQGPPEGKRQVLLARKK